MAFLGHTLGYRKYTPHLLIVLVQIGSAFVYFTAEASFNHGMNPHIYVTYRYVVAGLVMIPVAYFLERKERPKLTLPLLFEISLLSLLGVGLTLNMFFASLKYTSPTFITAMVNTIPSLTFIFAVIFRLEILDIRNPHGIAKTLGSIISFAGVLTMILYKGPVLESLQGAPIHIRKDYVHDHWIKGAILTVVSCILSSLWFIMQAVTLKKYPAQLSLATLINCIGGAQSAIFAVIIQHKPAAWSIRSKIDFFAIIYGAVISSGLAIFIQLWCTQQKGPVFVTMFNPLATVLVTAMAYFIFGETLHIASIVGGIIAIVGLYIMLWGKEGDQNLNKCTEDSYKTDIEQSETKVET